MWVRGTHTAIYLTMAVSTVFILYCGITRISPPILPYAVALMVFEGVIFFGNGMKCPMTNMAVKYGAETGHVGDTFLPVKWTKYTFRVFGNNASCGFGAGPGDLHRLVVGFRVYCCVWSIFGKSSTCGNGGFRSSWSL